MQKKRKIFFVVVSGGHDTEHHFQDTIERKRTIAEIKEFLPSDELYLLDKYVNENPFAAWGAVPGSGNTRTWETMEEGDYVIIYRSGKIIRVAEVAMKTRNLALANYFWKKDKEGNTWEYIYFLINDEEVNVEQATLNKYLGYKENYFPRGFTAIDQEKVDQVLLRYGDLVSLLRKLEKGEKVEEIDSEKIQQFKEIVDEKIEKAPTEHDEMQWRLIRLGNKSKLNVWVPRADQGRQFEGHTFRDFVIEEFQESLDTPTYIENIDTVWKLGLSIKAAFEIEHSTTIFSGILRLSDLKALAPNSNYPLFIVANRERKSNVFNQLRRPTFSCEYLHLDKDVKFLDYEAIRELDQDLKSEVSGFDISWLTKKAESVS